MNEAVELLKIISQKLNLGLDIIKAKSVDNAKAYPLVVKVAQNIEDMEKDWSHKHTGNGRMYGQKIEGEAIKLWSVPKTSAQVLELLVVASGSKQIVEVGTSAGYSALYLAMGAKYNSGRVTTIENLDVKAELARKNFQESGLDNINLIEGDAQKAIAELDLNEIDFVFLDADKENYDTYFDLLIPKLKIGALIVADNVFDYGHMMQGYLGKVLGTKLPGSTSDPRVQSYTLPIDNGLLVTKKISD